MSQIATKAAAALAKPLLPYLRHLPQPLLTLVPVLALHVAGHQEPTSISWFLDPMVNPMHPPILLTMVMIPCIYALGLVTGYISWVDKLWPFYTPLHSLLIVLWTIYNPSGAVYGHNLPRLGLMLLLQVIWSTRLTSHAIRRGFYEMRSQDYRYDVIKAIFPGWAYQLVHLFAVAIAQPLLLLGLSLPLHAVLMLPPMELSPAPIPALSIPYSAFKPFLPAHFHSASGSTPVLNLADLVLFVIGCGFVLIEYKADNAMYAFQQTKHGSKSKDVVQPQLTPQQKASKGPKPTAYPRSHHPGFITSGLFSWVRHPNFMGEQLFWVTQALFVVAAGESSGITKSGWVKGSVFGPCFALSLLFCGSTFITEWITARKYPAYRSYQKVVGQFVPQETMFKRLLGLVTPQRRRDALKELKAKTA